MDNIEEIKDIKTEFSEITTILEKYSEDIKICVDKIKAQLNNCQFERDMKWEYEERIEYLKTLEKQINDFLIKQNKYLYLLGKSVGLK